MLTSKDQKVLIFIREYIRTHGHAPTLSEIKNQLGYNWLNSVQRSISNLEKEGFIQKEKNLTRGINLEESKTPSLIDIPLVGMIPCGSPLLAVENVDGYIPTDSQFIKSNSSDYFYLKAQGDSMNLAGINNNDLLLIHKQQTAEDGDRVVALIGDEATVKILRKGSDFVILEPSSSNPKHRPIILRDNLVIQGVVDKVLSLK